MSKTLFLIESGQFGLKKVDTAAVGYLDGWQAPAGKTLATATIADYDTGSATWSCQVTSGALNATPDTTTSDVPATFCDPAETTPSPGVTQFELAVSFLQDVNISTGLNRFLFENDTEEAYWYLGFNATDPPKAIGRCRVQSGTMGGEPRVTLTADLTLPCSRKPDIEFGNATASVIVEGDGTIVTGFMEGTLSAEVTERAKAEGATSKKSAAKEPAPA